MPAEKISFPATVIICLSGTGSNAKVLLEHASGAQSKFKVAALFTDAPQTGAAFLLGEKFNVPVETLDIEKFYAENGETSIRLNSPRRWELRRLWSEKVWQLLAGYNADFAVFAGFVPLNSLPEKLPCLNVHPGDLTVENDHVRRYAGLHFKPVERALLDGNPVLRSSVILVQALQQDDSCEIDGGPILGISAPVPVDWQGNAVSELNEIFSNRGKAPYDDKLRQLAKLNIETLKYRGDHVVLPRVADAFASGRYALSADGKLNFLDPAGKWQRVKTVEFSAVGGEKIIEENIPAAKRPRKSLWRFVKYLYSKIVRGKGSPDYIARGWSLGMFVGCVVPIFCQLIVAVPLSFVIRGSKIGAALGTFITTPPTAIFIYPVQIWVGNKLINGNLSADAAKNVLKVFTDDTLSFTDKWRVFAEMGGDIVAAFFAGGLLWAAIMTPLTYFLVRFLVIRYRKLREAVRSRNNGAA